MKLSPEEIRERLSRFVQHCRSQKAPMPTALYLYPRDYAVYVNRYGRPVCDGVRIVVSD